MPRFLLLLAALFFCGSLRAHTVPVVVIEAEFAAGRQAVIKVNLDPRLFLSSQPTSVPPVPASWWFEQDVSSQEATRKTAAEYVQRTFGFTVGTTALQGAWKVEPIDSASAFPLGEASTEAHLLVEHRGALPASAGDFKVAVGKECAVAVILLCSNVGDSERRPQSLFPGETSRPFPLPALAESKKNGAVHAAPQEEPGSWAARLEVLVWLARSGHFMGDHLLLAALLGIALSRRVWQAMALVAVFHGVDMAATGAVVTGWLPSAPVWMTFGYWIAMAVVAVQLLVLKSKDASAFLTLAAAALCHGLNAPHLHLGEGASFTQWMFGQAGLSALLEAAVVVVVASTVRLALRRRQQRPCPTAA